MEILSARPKGMSYADYREHMKNQAKWIKQYRFGSVIYISWEFIYNSSTKERILHRYLPFRGSTKSLRPL